jgi:hypothetical protein
MTTFTLGPWRAEGFEQIEGHGNFYGGLIMGADDCTIVAQCVMPHNESIIKAAPEMLEALQVLTMNRHMMFPTEFGGYVCRHCAGSLFDAQHFRAGEDAKTDMEKARKVVAKATGAA